MVIFNFLKLLLLIGHILQWRILRTGFHDPFRSGWSHYIPQFDMIDTIKVLSKINETNTDFFWVFFYTNSIFQCTLPMSYVPWSFLKPTWAIVISIPMQSFNLCWMILNLILLASEIKITVQLLLVFYKLAFCSNPKKDTR